MINSILIVISIGIILFKINDDKEIKITLIKVNIIMIVEIGSIIVKDKMSIFLLFIIVIIIIIIIGNVKIIMYIIL